jgi:GNAT superfamily N-acetyltransferase
MSTAAATRLPITLRAAQVADAPAVATLYLDSRRRWLPYAPLAHDDADVHRWFAQQCLPAGGVSLAVDADERLLGFVATSLDPQGDRAWIDQLYVSTELVGKGLGALMLEHALVGLPRPVRLHTFAVNEGARRFYERAGFIAESFGDGSGNEEGCPDVRYVLR